MKECPNCGAQVDDAAAVCRYCATQLEGGAPTHAESFAPEPPRAPEPPPYEPFREPPTKRQPPAGQYGQQPPPAGQYGQQPPPAGQYGQQPPPAGQYGQQPPPAGQYGQQPPPAGQYGQQSPPAGQYEQQPPPAGQYGQQPPSAGQYGPNTQPPAYPPQVRDPRYRNAERLVAGLLAILLGTYGVHKFYLGKIGAGILCIVFFWTCVPTIVGLIEGIIYLTMDDNSFREKYCRLY